MRGMAKRWRRISISSFFHFILDSEVVQASEPFSVGRLEGGAISN